MTDAQQKQPKHVMMMAAGTGGHVFPALAVAKDLEQQGIKVSWLATPAGMENRLLKNHNIPIYQIDIQGVRGNGVVRKLVAPFKILKATLSAMKYMKQLKVDAVAGFGGYVAGPGGLAARMLGIPVIIHEQNAVAGFTNTQLSRIAKKVCQAFPNTFPAQDKIVTTGNPVRKEITEIFNPSWRYQEREKAGQPLRILIVGGSLGAQALNECVPEALKQLNVPLNVYHQCGQNHADATRARYADAPATLNIEVQPFIEDMAQAYSDADLIICRAGALTVTEIATAGVAAIFVPLPSAVDDHQTANARFLANLGAAKICPQATMTPDSLKALLEPMLNRQLLMEMAVKARQQAQPDATQHVVRLIQEL
ncbi:MULTISPECIES: undecaprenyldiphospho-muramoylpentapeptide beta-N-acetylglucosaminyltransferase [Acinetobacter]|uniref:UDP-N-acetylglucosamine--N-acetylmuramyl-(pentapeptide) pyrophosphoryl-undecaprenol N-acetylglucosamine transferase n=1 Tax=Acinetobacter schindleri CIP 107287 TaxID=1217988 RepID=N8Z9E2_9GAMM|nr:MULTISPECIES: undecaprenyldiphospho-muramoylpentapeptide beta-N-acetylglucosaminyltransferase [Acinetobacter]ENV45712.1 undecaprenyldiphospho-muramoylpentapeptide beta-N-acetylglucosaminyltransferase [Acinetobacter schindleri CIP 107287]MCK8641092.1 undecaprenyldiphospho-muramoylpentapeptide beta-N-acetylglucosaminyltransferase [Acinetobacter schindleri]MCU4520441.1 undecaprenyldiphospho-muramoylpentapeptide beta-N-acetylglucosaminyltransferase [Acinetobacter schindleri]OIJ38763.1 undecapren